VAAIEHNFLILRVTYYRTKVAICERHQAATYCKILLNFFSLFTAMGLVA